jgi:hypothetical protein
MAFFVVVSLAFLIGVARREVSYSLEGSVSFDGVDYLVFWRSFESLGVGLSKGLEGALIGYPVAFRVDSVVGTFMVVGELRGRVQAVDNVGIDELRLSSWACRVTPPTGVLGSVEEDGIV